MKTRLIYFWMIVQSGLLAQSENLVLNPGFEELKPGHSIGTCEYNKNSLRFSHFVPHWMSFLDLTTDLIIWEEGCRYPKPHGGNNMIGLITYHPKLDTGWDYDYHEFLQGELKSALVPGQTYEIEFYIYQHDSVALHHLLSVYGRNQEIFPAAAGNIGIYLSTIPFKSEENMRLTVSVQAVKPQVNHARPVVTSQGAWKRIFWTFTADRPYRYFVIGNFSPDEWTETTLENEEEINQFNLQSNKFWEKKKRVAYYCLDDIRIAAATDLENPGIEISDESFSDQTYVFRDVTFALGKSEIMPASLPELKALTAWLQEHPGFRLEVSGHTDHTGTAAANLELSTRRAEAVCKYLIELGVPSDRLSWKGYGESKPVADNGSEAGRQRNRRVECRLIEGN